MRPRMFWLVGLLVAGIASLRAHYLAAATVTVVAFLMIDMWRHRDAVRARMISLFHAGGASVVFLLPWMATLWQSSSTPMYPVFPGTHRPDYENYSAPLGFSEHLSFFGDVMISPGVALFAVPVILYAFRRASLAGLALYLGALVTTAVLSWVFTYSDAENIHRYVAPFLNAAFFATVSVLVLQARAALPTGVETIKHRRVIDAVLCGAIVFLFPVMVSQDMARLTDKWGKPTLPAAARAVYARLQSAVPAGEKLFVIVSQPAALNYRRNEIAGVDVPGAASPEPGMPFFAGPDALRNYLKKQGFSYLAFGDFSRPGGCLYDRRLWTHNKDSQDSRYREGRFQARYYLDLMDNIEALALTEEQKFSEAGLTLLRLNGP